MINFTLRYFRIINLEYKCFFKLHVMKFLFQNIFYLNASGRVILKFLTNIKNKRLLFVDIKI